VAIPATHLPTGEGPSRRLWTRAEFDRAAEMGLFGPEERLELVAGRIYVEASISPQHATAIQLCSEAMRRMFASGHDVRIRMPLALGEYDKPDPDVAVVAGSYLDYEEEHPTTAVLVIEVADTTVSFDRTTKAQLYARAAIQEYWVVNLKSRLLEVHREPVASEEPGGSRYKRITKHTESETVTPLGAPGAAVLISDLLPSKR
jgi:Uma2 family endonuclease